MPPTEKKYMGNDKYQILNNMKMEQIKIMINVSP